VGKSYFTLNRAWHRRHRLVSSQ